MKKNQLRVAPLYNDKARQNLGRGNGFPGYCNTPLSHSSAVRSLQQISKNNYIPQPNDWSCGVAVYRMVCKAFGVPAASFKENLLLLGTNPSEGTSQSNLVNGLRKTMGNVCEIASGYAFTAPKDNNKEPTIGPGYGSPSSNKEFLHGLLAEEALVVVNFREPEDRVGHYAIVQAVSDTSIELADPWHGRISVLPLDEFDWRSGLSDPVIHGWFATIRPLS